MTLGGSSDGHRIEERRLQQHVGRHVGNLTERAAHDARQAQHDVVAVDNDAVLSGIAETAAGLGEGSLDSVESRQHFTRASATRAQGALRDVGRVIGVSRLAEFEHHQVGSVDHVGDRAHARQGEAPSQVRR